MNDVILVVGLPGVGKPTVFEEAMRHSNKEYKLANYGDRMLEIAQTEGLVEHRDELHTLAIKTQKRLQNRLPKAWLKPQLRRIQLSKRMP